MAFSYGKYYCDRCGKKISEGKCLCKECDEWLTQRKERRKSMYDNLIDQIKCRDERIAELEVLVTDMRKLITELTDEIIILKKEKEAV